MSSLKSIPQQLRHGQLMINSLRHPCVDLKYLSKNTRRFFAILSSVRRKALLFIKEATKLIDKATLLNRLSLLTSRIT